jgi:hypothetical protein
LNKNYERILLFYVVLVLAFALKPLAIAFIGKKEEILRKRREGRDTSCFGLC